MSQQQMPIVSIVTEEDQDLGNSICLPYFDGESNTAEPSGQMCINVNDIDTVKMLIHNTDISAGSDIKSIHLADDVSSYQNTSGNDAFVIMVISSKGAGSVTRDIKIWDSPVNNDKTGGAILRLESSTGLPGFLNGSNKKATMGVIKISNNNYCVIENATVGATNDINISDTAWVVERG